MSLIDDSEVRSVSGCVTCPFLEAYNMSPGFGCKLEDPNNKDREIKISKTFLPETPLWCLLRVRDITFKLDLDM